MSGSNITVEYSWLKNSGGDIVQIQSPGGGNVTLRYNLIEQAGQGVGSHGDFLQIFTGAPVTATILYNTTLQSTRFTQGFMLEPDGGPWGAGIITSADVGNNTMLARGSGTQYFFTGVTVADIVNTVSVHDNYFAGGGLAPGGVRSGPNDSSSKTNFVNNMNMATGAVVQDANPSLRIRRP